MTDLIRFRWVSLQIQALCNSQRIKHETDLINELGRLPKSLKDSYDVIYELIENSGDTSRGIAESTIKWLLCAQEPLQHQELIAAVSVDPDGHYSALSIGTLLDMCCNLVVSDAELDIFRFAHLSVREYFDGRGDYTKFEMHSFAAERCLDTYLDKNFPKPTISQNKILKSYATEYWPIHYKVVENQPTESLSRKLDRFLFYDDEISPSFKKWASAVKHHLSGDHQVLSRPPTPLFTACFYGLVSIIDLLIIRQKLEWKQQNKRGHTCLTLAANSGQPEIVKKLLTMNFDVNDVGSDVKSALHCAVQNNQFEITKILLSANANVNAGDVSCTTALHYAAQNGNSEILKTLLLGGADLKAVDQWNQTALHYAVQKNKLGTTKILLSAGVNVNAVNYRCFDSQRTPLFYAVRQDNLEITKVLLSEGANVNAVIDHDGHRMLHIAAILAFPKIIKALLLAGADVIAVNKRKQTALHLATEQGNIEIVKTLISNRIYVNAPDDEGRTALHLAVEHGNIEIVKTLLSAGVNVHAIVEGRTALQVAKNWGHLDIVEELRKAGAVD